MTTFTSSQLRQMAEFYGEHDAAWDAKLCAMLRQASEDAEDAARWRSLISRVFYVEGRFRASAVELASIALRGVPGQSGGDLLTACVDAARTPKEQTK